jgi:hypothetical protein
MGLGGIKIEEESYKRAKARVAKIRAFYSHLATYIVVNIMLIIINLLTSPDSLWFYWITIFWGFFILWNALDVFGIVKFFGKDWEEKKIKEIMEEEDRK